MLETFYLNDDEIEIYEAKLKWLRDEAAGIQKAELKGRQTALIQTAEKMRALGMPLDTIAEAMGISLVTLNELTMEKSRT